MNDFRHSFFGMVSFTGGKLFNNQTQITFNLQATTVVAQFHLQKRWWLHTREAQNHQRAP